MDFMHLCQSYKQQQKGTLKPRTGPPLKITTFTLTFEDSKTKFEMTTIVNFFIRSVIKKSYHNDIKCHMRH